MPDTGSGYVALDLYATMRDSSKMHEGRHLANDGLLHRCELVKEVAKLLCPQIHVWGKILAGRLGRRIRDVSGNGSHAVSGGITPSLFDGEVKRCRKLWEEHKNRMITRSGQHK